MIARILLNEALVARRGRNPRLPKLTVSYLWTGIP
jgi:hypothetical protein